MSDRELIIGATGYIGRHLAKRLPDAVLVARNSPWLRTPKIGSQWFRVDLMDVVEHGGSLPDAEIVYLCAGINGSKTCSMDPVGSYKVNVDGTIWVAEHYRDRAFVVWISSITVMWLTEHYGRQKQLAEQALRTMPHVGIVRAGRVLDSNIDDLCDLLIDVGRNRRHEIVLWNEMERPYER